MSIGGKRVRPVMLVATALMHGAEKKETLLPAAALEIAHNYTLVVDDIMDKSEKRRGRNTCWKEYGKMITECIGIGYAMTYADILARLDGEVAEELSSNIKPVTEGQVMDVLQERGPAKEPYIKRERYERVTMEDYFEMVEKKTASLLVAACRAGGAVAGVEKEGLRQLEDFGRNLGIAFQVRDDFLDIFGEEEEFGKQIGKDIMERKGGNAVVLFALEESDELSPLLEKERIGEREVREAMRIIESTHAKERTEEMAREYIEKAENSLYNFPQNEYRDILKDLKDYILIRKK